MKSLILFSVLAVLGCSSSTKVYKQSDNFIDIEIAKENFYMECAVIDKNENKSLMTFYAINGDTVEEFIFRRISPIDQCENTIKKYFLKIIKDVQAIQLVGITPLEKKRNYLEKEMVPELFKKPHYLRNWTFIRLQTLKGCEAYFDNDCEPENYWGGLFPQK